MARNGCVCEGKSAAVNLPFSQLLFPRVSASALHTAFQASELEALKERRAKEYHSFQTRSVPSPLTGREPAHQPGSDQRDTLDIG